MHSFPMAILLLFALVQIDPNQKYLDYLSSSLVDHNGVRTVSYTHLRAHET